VVIPEFVVERLGHDASGEPSVLPILDSSGACPRIGLQGNCFPDAFAGKQVFCCDSGEAGIA
jgi:hypothetical protein